MPVAASLSVLSFLSCFAESGPHLPEHFRQHMAYHDLQANFIHPILGIKAGSSISEKKVDNSMFSKLNRYEVPEHLPLDESVNWSSYFSRGETETAWLLCKKVLGLSKKQVESLAGAPTFKFSKRKGAPLKSNHEFWLYNFGHSWTRLVFEFQGDECIRADDDLTIWGLKKSFALVDWRMSNIKNFAIGKTEQEITRELQSTTHNRTKLSGKSVLSYDLTAYTGINFSFKNGKCVKAEQYLVAH